MRVIKPTIKFIDQIDGDAIIRKLDKLARVCYQSTPKSNYTMGNLIKNCIKSGHESVIEHVSLTFDLVTDIGVLAELTRHRLASYSVESTRYCKYLDDIEYIEPIEFRGDNDSFAYKVWRESCLRDEDAYCNLMDIPSIGTDIARNVLNKSVKTEIIFTMNLRELRNMFKLRCSKPAHAHIKQVMIPLLLVLKERIPIIFDDIDYDRDFMSEYLTYFYDENHDTIYAYEKGFIQTNVCNLEGDN